MHTNTKRLQLEVFQTKEASAFLGITPNALRIKVHRGQIKAEKLDQKLRFRISCLLSSFTQLED